MAKYRRVRRFRRKHIWSTNINNIYANQVGISANSISALTLCTNPAQSTSTVSQKYTVKNIELSYTIELDPISESIKSQVENLAVYICYVPQGFNISTYSQFIQQHPEYIMAYRFLGSPNLDDDAYRNPLFIKSRLARTLNTGDEIKLLIQGTLTDSGEAYVNVSGIVRYWTKAN